MYTSCVFRFQLTELWFHLQLIKYTVCIHAYMYAFNMHISMPNLSPYIWKYSVTQLFSFPPSSLFQFTFQANLSNMAENILEQLIEVVDASNTFIGYVSGTLPQKEDNTRVVMLDNDLNDHDNDHDTDSTISVEPEAPPEIPSDIDMDIDNHNILSPIENSDNEGDS